MEEREKKELYAKVLRKATGYVSREVQEEYALVDGEMQLVKRKITHKDVPPDITAIKLLMGDERPETVGREELERERRELTEEFYRMLAERGQTGKDEKEISQEGENGTRKNTV